MVLKAFRLRTKKKKKKKKIAGDIITGGVTALVGIGLLSQTSQAVNRI